MSEKRLQILLPGSTSPRLHEVLAHALEGRPHVLLNSLEDVRPGALLFAAAIGKSGVNTQLYDMIGRMRVSESLLQGNVGGMLIDGESELYTKSVARELLFAANRCGCAFPGKPLVEGTGSLYNFTVQAGNQGVDLLGAYKAAAAALVERMLAYTPPKLRRPRLLVLHAGNRATSNTLTLWGMVRGALGEQADVHEIQLRNGAVADCEGCAYTTCLHLGERGSCFYGGVIVEEVYPAMLECDALLLLCPNYNDAADANITAFINRLTALFRNNSFYEKALFGIIVSGYSGGDIVAEQLLSGLCMNKSFQLPPKFCLLETANSPGSILQSPGIEARAAAFAQNSLQYLLQ